MFKSFSIKNFRCFEELTLDSLERVNLIAGKNNTGKTSLLEAIFLHIGFNNPGLALRINVFRGIERFTLEPEQIWGPLFFDKRLDQAIELTSVNEDNERGSLKISLAEVEEPIITTEPPSSTATARRIEESIATGMRELILDYQDSVGHNGTSRAFITPEGQIKVKRSELKSKLSGVMLPARYRFLESDAERFSKLDRLSLADQLLPTMRLLEPRLQRLAVLVTGGVPMINGDIGLKELVPVPLMGEGMVRLLSILLAIVDSAGGVVLVDEIENGLHHSVLVNVWKAIAVAARNAEAQLFATTHSWECIEAAHKAFIEDGIYDFRLHRLEVSDNNIVDVLYDQEILDAAVKATLEVR